MMESEVVNGNHAGLVNGITAQLQNGDVNSGELSGSEVSERQNSVSLISVGQDHRIKKKAKRLTKQLSKETVVNGNLVTQAPRQLKNSRRPRNGYGRGLPKKGGAGGKGVWGKLGSELEVVDDLDDINDPNYDSDTVMSDSIELKAIIPEDMVEQMNNQLDPIILEYYEHGDTYEAELALEELNITGKRYLIVKRAVELALDHKPSHREMTSVVISDLYTRLIGQRDIAKAFDLLLKDLPDLILDTPEAPMILGNFIARAIADDCLPPKFVQSYKERLGCEHARQSLIRADTLLSMDHGLLRLDNVWGVGGGLRPVKSLVRQMGLLLQEYVTSEDLPEAARCVQELEVPHFHHELVYEAIVMAIEAFNQQTEEKICRLLKYLCSSVIITPNQMERGFLRVYEDMPDICLDVPVAYSILERFVEKCQRVGGILTEEIVKKLPSRGRKRFVSEGDGGRVKDHSLK